jgi:hypothetical protein
MRGNHAKSASCFPRWSAAGLLLIAACSPPSANGTGLSAHDLCVTEGHLEDAGNGRLSVNVPKMRAYVNGTTADVAELRFTYLGPTAASTALGSGAVRTQFGLKLRAQDACNLLYVMWREKPVSELVVSLKTNPGQHTSAQCGNQGYQNLKPQVSSAIPALRPGDAHRLQAEIKGQELRALVDGKLVWQGLLDSTAASLKGPVGVRTDNAHLEFQLIAKGASASGARCRSGAEEAD